MTASPHAETPQAGEDAAPGATRSAGASAHDHIEATRERAAFAFAPLSPLMSMGLASAQAAHSLLESQTQFALVSVRMSADAWRLALRRQREALFGVPKVPIPPPTEESQAEGERDANHIANPALTAAVDAVKAAGRELVDTQARALKRLRHSA